MDAHSCQRHRGDPLPSWRGIKEARDRQLGLGVLEGTGCWGCVMGYHVFLHDLDLLVQITCKLHLFVTEATSPHAGDRDHGGTDNSTGSPDCYWTQLVSAKSFCLEVRSTYFLVFQQ